MKNFTLGAFMCLLLSINVFAQDSSSVFATMDSRDAIASQQRYPGDIQILEVRNNQSAVLLSNGVAEQIKENVQLHGSGYIFKTTEELAIAALNIPVRRPVNLEYSITEDGFVNECLDLVNPENIESDILDLQGYGTRYHTKPQARQAVLDQQAKWDAMIAASGRTDVHTRIYEHDNTPMPSVILTMDGANNPDEYVIIGGHIDSTSWDKDDAPGADDNASGIASLNEMVRVLLLKEFVPSRTIEVMAFAAEEIGLVGSAEIAEHYADNNIDVAAYVQFDMTGYKGSAEDVYIMTDYYNSDSLNNYLAALMDHYNASGAHAFTYGYSECGYGCSDHASWASNGYDAAMPFEAAIDEDNPNIHSPYDTYSFFGTPEHATKFTKLGLQFLIEAAKPQVLGINESAEMTVDIFVAQKTLNYSLKNLHSPLKEITVYNASGQVLANERVESEMGLMDLKNYSSGFYIAKFVLENGQVLSSKLILN